MTSIESSFGLLTIVIIGRFNLIEPLHAILIKGSDYASTFLSETNYSIVNTLFVGWLPRSLRPDQVTTNPGIEFGKIYGLIPFNQFEDNIYMAPSMIGDLYIQFGYVGALLMLFLVFSVVNLLYWKLSCSKQFSHRFFSALILLDGILLSTQIWLGFTLLTVIKYQACAMFLITFMKIRSRLLINQ